MDDVLNWIKQLDDTERLGKKVEKDERLRTCRFQTSEATFNV